VRMVERTWLTGSGRHRARRKYPHSTNAPRMNGLDSGGSDSNIMARKRTGGTDGRLGTGEVDCIHQKKASSPSEKQGTFVIHLEHPHIIDAMHHCLVRHDSTPGILSGPDTYSCVLYNICAGHTDRALNVPLHGPCAHTPTLRPPCLVVSSHSQLAEPLQHIRLLICRTWRL
jgi:hypothetical protein